MFIGCYEISINVIVRHVEHIGIIRAFYQPVWTCQVFQFPVGQKNLLDFGLLVRDQYPDSHYVFTKYLVILLND